MLGSSAWMTDIQEKKVETCPQLGSSSLSPQASENIWLRVPRRALGRTRAGRAWHRAPRAPQPGWLAGLLPGPLVTAAPGCSLFQGTAARPLCTAWWRSWSDSGSRSGSSPWPQERPAGRPGGSSCWRGSPCWRHATPYAGTSLPTASGLR